MNSGMPPPPDELLDPELRALFDAEATYSDMPASAPGHILAKVSAALLVAPVITAAATQAASTSHVAGAAHVARATAWQAIKRTATWVAFGAGAASGAAGYATVEHAAVQRPEAHVVSASSAPAAAAAVASAPVAPEPPPTVNVPVLSVPAMPNVPTAAVAPAATPATHAGASEDGELTAERAQLETARTALARGEASAALGVLRADATARPHGRLAEERDGMTVQALALAGRTDEARTRAAAFSRKYPRSLLLPMVHGAVANVP